MEFQAISELINQHGLAVALLIIVIIGGYNTIAPYVKKKLDNRAENDDKLEDNVHTEYFEFVKETRDVNKQIVSELKNINVTNMELSETNKELSKTNRKLVESYDRRICTLEDTTDDICKTVEKINTKVDIILK